MSKLDKLIFDMISLFKEYVEGDEGDISMDELKKLLDKELSTPEFREKIHADDVSRAMDFLDKNHDGEVNFNEFSKCVATLARGCYKKEKKEKKDKKGKKDKKDKKNPESDN